jgi:hypothetical protein
MRNSANATRAGARLWQARADSDPTPVRVRRERPGPNVAISFVDAAAPRAALD